ncbi:hypothetical protein [Dictyobacter arantiisoli]|uniref:Uncharacterized protein n=1 Tax=Dictyobacter arantiisoli TaxID=2014874 RepID=A0A5A5T8J3_9CHLR|nr:hypothetical protein [Dictyobacter arantiisoli]GCF07486.1 hypothetical protein KDI_10500 [Dictyobacter arantiisoli]
MSQEYKTAARRTHRRVPHNRPVLVTGTETQEEVALLEPQTEDLTRDTGTLAEPEIGITPVKSSRRSLSLPKFFSKVEKSEVEESTDEDKVVEARMARAKKSLNGKNATTKENDPVASSKPAARAQTPAKPRLFKTRHIIGMVVYLFGANLVLPYERTLTIGMNIEKNLFTIPGINLPVSTSFLLNIITLIVLLYVLVALDFLPNGKQIGNAQVNSRNNNKSVNANTSVPKAPQATIRQGVKGEHDNLYQSYRTNQRKKR